MRDETHYAWSNPESLVSIDIPEAFAAELFYLARRWDQGLTTTEDDVACLEVAIAYLTNNLSEEEATEALNLNPADLRGLVRDAAQNGMHHADKEGRAILQLSRGKIKAVEAPTEAPEKEIAEEASGEQASKIAAGHTVSRFDDKLAAMMHSAKITIKE